VRSNGSEPPPQRPQSDYLTWLCILLIGLSFLAHVGYLYRTGFVNPDEPWLDLSASSVRNQGLTEYIHQAAHIAKLQGRIQYIFSWGLFLAPHFIASDLERAIVDGTMHFLSLALLAWFLAYYTGARNALLLLALLYGLLPYARLYWPLPSFPFAFSLPIILFFLGLGLYLRSHGGAWHPRWRYPLRLISLGAVLLSMFVYEGETLCFGLIALLCLWKKAASRAHGFRARLTAMMRSDWPVLAVMGAIAASYLVFRLRYGSHYNGTSIAWTDVTNFGLAWNVVQQFALTGLPAVNFFVRLGGVTGYWIGNPRFSEAVPFILGNLTMVGFLKSLLGGVAVWLFGIDRQVPSGKRPGGPALALPMTALLLTFLVQAPLAITPKYQHLASVWSPYITGYFSFICFTVFLWGVLAVLKRSLAWREWSRRLVFAGLGLAVFVCGVLTSISNQGLTRQQQQSYLKWRVVNALLKSAPFREMPEGVVVAPTLWEGIEYVTWEDTDQYWTDYAKGHSRRYIQFLRAPPVNSRDLIAAGRLYCAQIQPTFDGQNAVLLFARLRAANDADGEQAFVSDRLSVIGDIDYKHAAVSMVTRGPHRDDAPVPRQVAVGAFQFENGAYVATLDQPGMVADSWRVISNTFIPIPNPLLEVVLQSGFSRLEMDDAGQYWAWSNGSSGTGVVNIINRKATPQGARFITRVTTASTKATKFDLEIQGRPESAWFHDNEQFERVLILQPGDNEIQWHSNGGRIAAPGDDRYLVFGLRMWSVTPN